VNVVRFVPHTKGRPQWSLAAPSESGAWRNLESYYFTALRDELRKAGWEVKPIKLPDDSRAARAPRPEPANPPTR
jgi:hypothetical protein